MGKCRHKEQNEVFLQAKEVKNHSKFFDKKEDSQS